MFSDKVFQITFLVSVITHGIILFQNPLPFAFTVHNRNQRLELSYIKQLQASKTEPGMQNPAKESLLKLSTKIHSDKIIPPPFIDKESIFKSRDWPTQAEGNFSKPAFVRPDIISFKKKITLPPIEMDKINDPSYLSYYQIVREKIKRAAYQNYTGKEVGDIALSFAISDNGTLKELRFIEGRSSSATYLRQIALRSLKDAAPFPNFPKELNYPELSFNLVITFEVE